MNLEPAQAAAGPAKGAREVALRVAGLQAWYGESHVLHGVDISILKNEVVTLLGRNGAGKSTTLKAVMGLLPKRTGSVVFEGRETIGMRPCNVGRLGIAYCPEERGIFSTLSVEENLMLPPVLRPGGMSRAEVYALFPNLAERTRAMGTKLSGGEQQMLAIGRILRTGATTLLLDEPAEGLAPTIVQDIGRVIRRLKERGTTIFLVEQNFRFAASVADRHFVMEGGRIVDHIERGEAKQKMNAIRRYLGV